MWRWESGAALEAEVSPSTPSGENSFYPNLRPPNGPPTVLKPSGFGPQPPIQPPAYHPVMCIPCCESSPGTTRSSTQRRTLKSAVGVLLDQLCSQMAAERPEAADSPRGELLSAVNRKVKQVQ